MQITSSVEMLVDLLWSHSMKKWVLFADSPVSHNSFYGFELKYFSWKCILYKEKRKILFVFFYIVSAQTYEDYCLLSSHAASSERGTSTREKSHGWARYKRVPGQPPASLVRAPTQTARECPVSTMAPFFLHPHEQHFMKKCSYRIVKSF